MLDRLLYKRIWKELAPEKSMIFLSGPRQTGKTTLAKMIAASFKNSLYFNWDIPDQRVRLLNNPSFFEALERIDPSLPLVIFDEIHKYKEWKNYLKGIFDQFHESYQFLVSGSGRLDIYQKGGDSLAGRYLLFHLWPLTVAELGGMNRDIQEFLNNPLEISMERSEELKKTWEQLGDQSGFPEPFLSGRQSTYRRWSNTYSQQLIREDIRDLTDIKSIKEMETLYFILPSKVGSPLSVASLAEDLHVSYNSVQSWLSIFERFFLMFSISPWKKNVARAIQKERKCYLWDTPRIKEPASKFENMVALELWRAITAWNDLGWGDFSFHFIKNKEKQEVDFLLAKDHEPFLLIETKLNEEQPSQALKGFQKALGVPALQLTLSGNHFRNYSSGGKDILVAPAYQWLSGLP
jgi:predicted AAA+ superfamily ATPase